MMPGIPIGRLDVLSLTVGVAVFSLALSPSAYRGRPPEQQTSETQQQASQPQQNPQPSPPPQDPSVPKPKKVWTNEDVISLRSPADTYRAEREAQEAAEAEAAVKKAELAKQIKEAGLTIKLPSTPEETRQLIKDKKEQITALQERLDRLTHDLPDALEPQKTAIQKQIEALAVDVPKDQLELKVLQGHLEDLVKTAPGMPPSGPPAPPPAPPSPENPL
jgi:hypothetical protein